MDTITRNNIFLDAWEDTLLDTFLKQDSCGMVTHFISNIMNNLYPDNNSFNTDEAAASIKLPTAIISFLLILQIHDYQTVS